MSTWVSTIPLVAERISPNAKEAIYKTAADIEARAKVAAPVDTGNLRSSIRKRGINQHAAEVVVGAEYGIYVEYGTSRMGAQPYLQPAVEAARPGFEAALRGVFP